MRGGSIPVLAWGTLLVVLLTINAIWSGKAIDIAEFGFAVLVIYAFAVVFVLFSRQAIRRGPPEPRPGPEVVPDLSLSAVLIALSVAAILFGFVWAHFLVFFGAGLLLLSLGRLVAELRAERSSLVNARAGKVARSGSAPEEHGIVTVAGRGTDHQAAAESAQEQGP